MGEIRGFLDKHFLHFNARELVAAARAYEAHVDAGGLMLVTLAGAMSTGELGIILSRLIRERHEHQAAGVDVGLVRPRRGHQLARIEVQEVLVQEAADLSHHRSMRVGWFAP